LAKGVYSSATLTKRHQEWGHFWAERGYVALLVDSFGPRGYPAGFERGSYDDRPSELNEVTIRPLDAYGALKYLRSRRDVVPDRIVLQGWSNGGSATLASMANDAVGVNHPTAKTAFRAALAFYPGCGLHARWADGYMPYAPVAVLIGSDDEEVSPKSCERLVSNSKASGGRIEIIVYPGAEHDFDDPGKKRQSKPANHEAMMDAFRRAEAFVNRYAGQ
jgi:carboxymethylenebutenolidase